MKKKYLIPLAAAMLAAVSSFTAWAGTWERIESDWKYKNDDGSHPANIWQWIDGDGDGILKCYYFDENGNLMFNTVTPDGYKVNAFGEWEKDGKVQIQKVSDDIKIAPVTEFTYGPINSDKSDGEAKRCRILREQWKASCMVSEMNIVKEKGYTNGLSNLVLEMDKRTREENGKIYEEEAVFQTWHAGNPTVDTIVKYKDIPYLISYGVAHHYIEPDEPYGYIQCETEVDFIEDISESRNAILEYITEKNSRYDCERELRELGYRTIGGGVEYIDDPNFGYQLIRFYDRDDGNGFQIIFN